MTDLLFALPEQPRTVRREPEAVYEAVLALRRAGCKVSRCGRDMHLVDRKRATNEHLIALAGLLGK